MNATVTCEKCGKPLGMFDGNICYECEKKAHEDFSGIVLIRREEYE